MATTDLLNAWREATRAAEMARRLAELALEASERADEDTVAGEEIAELAERAAAAARVAAERSAAFAADLRRDRVREANSAVTDARTAEGEARDRYHAAERDARRRHERGEQGPGS